MKNNKKDFIYLTALVLTFLVLVFFYIKRTYLYGATTDWYQHNISIPEYFRTLFYSSKDLFPDLALNIGSGQNIYNLSYYGLLNPIILLSYLFPHISMLNYLTFTTILIVLISTIMMYKFLRKHDFNEEVSLISSMCFLLSTPIVLHSHHHLMYINYFPFLLMGLYGVDKKFKTNKSWLLILSVFLMIMTSYYFSIAGILCVLIYALYVYLQKNRKVTLKSFFKTLFYMIGPILIGIFLSSLVTIPSLLAIWARRVDTTSIIEPVELFIHPLELPILYK